jgi:centromere/kinetochore protein ZW10
MADLLGGKSLVSAILKQSSELDNFHLEESIKRVEDKCENAKLEILEYLSSAYERFDEFIIRSDSITDLDKKIRDAVNDYQRVATHIQNDLQGRLAQSADKRKEVETRWKETEIKITFVQSLLEINEKINHCRQQIEQKQFLQATKVVKAVESLVNLISEIGCKAQVFKALLDELISLKSDVKCELQEQWNDCIKWTPPVPPTDCCNVSHTVPQNSPHFEGVVKAAKNILSHAEWQQRVKKYATKVLTYVIEPLMTNKDLTVTIETMEDHAVIKLTDSNPVQQPSVEDRLTELLMIFRVMCKMVPQDEEKDWMSLLGEVIEPDMSSLLIKEFLSKYSSSDQEVYQTISDGVANFECEIKSIGLVTDNYTELTDYTSNVDIHMTAQMCQQFLGTVRDVLMVPLHDAVSASSDDTEKWLAKLELYRDIDPQPSEDLQFADSEFDIRSLKVSFPHCLVSKSTKEFVELFINMLLKCTTTTSPVTAGKYYTTSRNMLELYMGVSEAYHKQSVGDLPRNAVLQHNNYMFVAHQLISLGYQFTSRVPLDRVTFIDYVPRLRNLGENCFLSEMEKQSNNIIEFLKPVQDFEDISGSTVNQEALSQGIKQGFLHLYKLGRIYREVLPVDLARRSMGGLLNVLIKELVNRVLEMEDISVNDASYIHNLFESEILQKGPVALSLSDEEKVNLSKVCSSWEQLKQIIFVLDADQDDIVKSWGQGKGLLAKHMSANDVKHMIKALFKNTNRRALTLSKITTV